MGIRRLLFGGLALSCLASVPAAAQEARTDTLRTVEDCLQCHATTADLSRLSIQIDPIKLYDPANRVDLLIDPRKFAGSNHGNLVCRVCHIIGKEVYPHLEAAKGQYLDCVYCHRRDPTDQKFEVARITNDYQRSVHYIRHPDKFTCYECHDPHEFDLVAPGKPILEIIQEHNTICLNCHDNPAAFGYVAEERQFPKIADTHDWLPNLERHWDHVRCIECHTPHTAIYSHEILPKERSEKKCIACHTTNSVLMTTLYKYVSLEERERYGFVNAVIFNESYVVGSTRNKLLDRLSVIFLLATVVGIAGHGVLRLILDPSKLMPPNRRYYLYPAWLRMWHWLNSIGFIVLNVTGLSMHFSDFEGPNISFATAMSVHNVAGIIL